MADNTIKIKFSATGDDKVIKAIDALDKSTKKLISTQASLAKAGKSQVRQHTQSQKAMMALDAKLRALGTSFKKVNIDTKVLTKAYQGNKRAIAQVRIASQKHIKSLTQVGNKTVKTANRTRLLGGTFAVLRSKMLLVNFALGLGIRQLGKFALASAKVDSMSRAFNTLSGEAGNTSGALNQLKQATNSTMSEFDLFQQANNAMILGVTKNSDEMAEMFDIAQRLGRALGRDTASSVESLITGIGRQSRLMLDNIGIIVKSDEAYEAYAKKLGITADKLSDADKKQAFLTATMESARIKVASIGKEVLSVQDTYDQMSTATANLTTATGNFLQPAMQFLSKTFTNVARQATIYLNTMALANKVITKGTSLGEKENITRAKIKNNLIKIEKLNANTINYESNKQKLQNSNINLEKDLIDIMTDMAQLRVESLAEQKIINKENEVANQKAKIKIQNLTNEEKMLKLIAKAEEMTMEIRQKNAGVLEEIASSNREIYKNNLDFELMAIDLQAQKFKDMKLNEVDIVKFAEEAKQQAVIENLEKTSSLYRGASATYDQFVSSLVDLEMTGKERREQIWIASRASFITFLGSLLKDKLKQLIAEKLITGASQATSVVQAKATGLAIASAYAVPASLASTASFGSASVAGQTGITASILATKALAKFEDGGEVGGRRHSQGGTMIEAERGEFVMSRSAVQSIGVETLNQMNQGGGGGLTLNISAPLVDETIIDTIIPAIQKAQRMNLA